MTHSSRRKIEYQVKRIASSTSPALATDGVLDAWYEDVGRPDSLEAVSYRWVNLLGVKSRLCLKSTLGSDARPAFSNG